MFAHLSVIRESSILYVEISVVIQRFITSEDVRQVKVFFFPEMRLYFLMSITAVCFMFLLKLRGPKTKVSTIYEELARGFEPVREGEIF